MRKRLLSRKLSLAKETIRSLIPNELGNAAGGVIACRKVSYGRASACDCSGVTVDCSDTCMECSTIQY